MAMNAGYAINGSFGTLYEGDTFMANCKKVEAKVTIDKEELKLSSTRRTGYKSKGVKGEGTIGLYKVDSKFLERVTSYMSNERSVQFVGQLLVVLDDPESLGVEKVLLKNVKFWEVNFGWTLDSILEEEIPFTFEDIQISSAIKGDATKAR
ncbi:tail tube protein [Tumebacillus sp. BK434]|uniref:phage tail tube protein n=1 Tax=Tumebacillus sp. BK434 TaxID=2512169 RepID=UPI001044B4C0|nr:phage tail tube protein [Tumebacillus sp. BK434]TCP57976.1 tail tube protein [Tumebacillus sp. BK434]